MFRRILLLLALAWLAGCSQKAISPESNLDTPGLHVEQAMRMLDRGDLGSAEAAIDRALALDPRYVEAFCARAVLRLEQGRLQEAEELSKEALDLADDRWLAWQTRARVRTALQEKDWYEDALKDFERALDRAGDNQNAREQILYYRGLTKVERYRFNEAVEDFSKVAGSRGDFGGKADAAMDKVQKILRARPGSEASSRVALQDEIDRGELAVLLVSELKLPDLLSKAAATPGGFQAPGTEGPVQGVVEPADIQKHWARSWINELISSGGMQLFPGGQFLPDEQVSRAEYAQILTRVLADINRDEGLMTRFFGEESKFSDLKSSHPAYNAAAVVSTRGIMSADPVSGAFRPAGSISGAEALLVIRQLQNELRRSYR